MRQRGGTVRRGTFGIAVRLTGALLALVIVAPLSTMWTSVAGAQPAPTLTITPRAAPYGSRFTIDGQDWPTRTRVVVTLRGGVEFSRVFEVTTSPAANFQLEIDSTDFPARDITVVAVAQAGGMTYEAVGQFTVTRGREPEQCFAETGKCVRGRFLDYWLQHGGLAMNGYPISDEFEEGLVDHAFGTLVQYFERVRLEYHPQNAGTPYVILLGQFGRILHPADPPVPPRAGEVYFPETGHNVNARFHGYWQANGGLAQFGYPLSEAFEERLEDGQIYTVQYFKRARFEHHPENMPPYDVLLGQFGRRIYAERRR